MHSQPDPLDNISDIGLETNTQALSHCGSACFIFQGGEVPVTRLATIPDCFLSFEIGKTPLHALLQALQFSSKSVGQVRHPIRLAVRKPECGHNLRVYSESTAMSLYDKIS